MINKIPDLHKQSVHHQQIVSYLVSEKELVLFSCMKKRIKKGIKQNFRERKVR